MYEQKLNTMTSSSHDESLEEIKTMMISIMKENEQLKIQLKGIQSKMTHFDKFSNDVKNLKEEMFTVKKEVKRLGGDEERLGKDITFEELIESNNLNAGIEQNDQNIHHEPSALEKQSHDVEARSLQSNGKDKDAASRDRNSLKKRVRKKLVILKAFVDTVGTKTTSADHEVYNTNTIHMFATSIVYQSVINNTRKSRSLAWIMAISSIIFLSLKGLTPNVNFFVSWPEGFSRTFSMFLHKISKKSFACNNDLNQSFRYFT